MKSKSISITDLNLLRDLFAPGLDLILIDPKGRVNKIESAESKKEFVSADGDNLCFVVDLSQTVFSCFLSNALEDVRTTFSFIHNPDHTIRWFFESDRTNAYHLSLYNSNSLKSKIYVSVSRIAWLLGKESLLISGRFEVQQLLVDKVKESFGIQEQEVCSFFTGTRGATRKVVIHVHSEKGESSFIKVPLTETARALVKNEMDMVKTLNRFDFTSLSLPKISQRINGHARLSDVKPAVTIPATKIAAIHANAVGELYAISHERKAIVNTEAWDVTEANMHSLSNELSFNSKLDPSKMTVLVEGLRKLYASISKHEVVSVSVSHGDFTPWNMYCDADRLYVYDWEMAKNGIPMLFDLFHFSYQSVILQQQKSYKEVSENIQVWLKQPMVLHIIQKYAINVQLHHALYLLFNVSHYLRQYLNEKDPLLQSAWMMDAWNVAIEDCLSNVKLSSK